MLSYLRDILLRCQSYLSHPAFLQSVAWINDGSESFLADIDSSDPLSPSVVVLVADLVSSSLADGDSSLSMSGEGEISLKWQLLLQRPSDTAFRIDFDHAVNVLRSLQQRVAGAGEASQVHDIDDESCHPLDIIYRLDGALVEAYFKVGHSIRYDQECVINNFEAKLEHLIVLDRRCAMSEVPSMDERKRPSRSKILQLI
ncbi:hypothetical protein BD779DRAFT_1476006 [Infundibulicybe gibba]|nr:hypothetical protein BD779DRAFT_1476006 [Infundibulicybe gibba]